MSAIRDIAVIGAGLMGHGIAQIFAQKGYNVNVMDIKEDMLLQAKERIRSNLSLMAQYGLIDLNDIEKILSRIKTTLNLRDAVSGVQFVVECVFENLKLKQDIFQNLDSICPEETILSTNTSVISISEISEKAKARERIIGTHFWNPPYLIPLVEVVRGRETSNEVFETTFNLLKEVGKHPVKVEKDVPGFIGNRLQHALWREAISIVEHGIADASAVDECVKFGFGLRLPILGPIENADMVGLDLTLSIHDYILKYIESSPNPSPLLKEKVKKGEIGFKSERGFYQWTGNRHKESTKNLQEYLMRYMQFRSKFFGEE